jgi:hypothetical protein
LALNTLPKGFPSKVFCSSLHMATILSKLFITRKSSSLLIPVPNLCWISRSVNNVKSILYCAFSNWASPSKFVSLQVLNVLVRLLPPFKIGTRETKCCETYHLTSGVTPAVVHPKSLFASTRSANNESPMYKTFGLARLLPSNIGFVSSSVGISVLVWNQSRHFVNSVKHPSE